MPNLSAPQLQAGLRQDHRKLTRPRQAILDIVAAANQHLTTTEIYRRAKAKYPHLGLTTVYRTLELLVAAGYVQRVHLAAGCHSYAAVAQSHGHHLVCRQCGRAEEFAECDLEALTRALQKKTGYEIDVHVLELMGRCPNCRAKPRRRLHRVRRPAAQRRLRPARQPHG